ncbi:MAG: hypothetical protein QNI86_11875 [Halieaceae bacterium]|nr:hypothetical protein [Halieaceae bacterium]
MGIADLLIEKIEKQMAAMNERLEAAEAEARAHRAEAESELAGAQLEEELLGRVNDLKDRIAEGKAYLQELAEAGDEKAEEMKTRISRFFD